MSRIKKPLQAVGRTRATIDTKVCNKKVDVDDVGPEEHARGDVREGARVTVAKHQPWSCVDYVDFDHKPDERPTRGSVARVPEGDKHFSTRFRDTEEASMHREDVTGRCEGYTGRGRKRSQGCTSSGIDFGELLDSQDSSPSHIAWTGKQTNRGWPGTAEGKINTAQGMAGDLVSNLNSEEKSAVAGIEN